MLANIDVKSEGSILLEETVTHIIVVIVTNPTPWLHEIFTVKFTHVKS